jgi:hypothetical protein
MTAYRTSTTTYSRISAAARAAKARRQAVLQRVKAQRVQTYKRTVADWMKDGLVLRGSDLRNRYVATRRISGRHT